MFGRKRPIDDQRDVEITDELYLDMLARPVSHLEDTDEFAAPLVPNLGDEWGPYTFEDVADRLAENLGHRLDLGSVILPLYPGFQLQVEMAQDGTPQAVHLTIDHGRITVAAYAAPKTSGQWREVAADLAETLRKDGSAVTVEDGPWGRELHTESDGADLRFIGVDGYRWMIRAVAAGPAGSAVTGSPLVAATHAVLRDTIIRRGNDPHPVRTPLPVVLPQELAEQLAEAHRRQVAERAAAQPSPMVQMAEDQPPLQALASGPIPTVRGPRRGADGSAMQQLGR